MEGFRFPQVLLGLAIHPKREGLGRRVAGFRV